MLEQATPVWYQVDRYLLEGPFNVQERRGWN